MKEYLVAVVAIVMIIASSFLVGRSTGVSSERLKQAESLSKAYKQRDELQTKLDKSDQALITEQSKKQQVITETVIKKEVVYRDRIKNVVVHDCVRDSGLLELYDAALGMSDSIK
jgi:mannitol-specific phosphotransferase system IIBC component